MTRVLTTILELVRRDDGQDLLEYGMLATLIAIGAIVAISTLGDTIQNFWWEPIANAF